MLIVAIGNRLRSDDGVGFEVAERVRAESAEPIDVVHSDDVLALMDGWVDEDVVVLVDAVRSGAAAGTVHRFELAEMPLPSTWVFASSHQVELTHALEIARAFGRLPHRLVVIGVEAGSFDYGLHLTPAVAAAVPEAAAAVLDYLPVRVA